LAFLLNLLIDRKHSFGRKSIFYYVQIVNTGN